MSSVWIIVMKMVSEASRHILALSLHKSEHYWRIHIISGLSGQVLTIGQCPRPGGSSLTITMTCDTLNCSRIVSWDQLEQFKWILKLPWQTRPPRSSLQKGNSIAQSGLPSLLARSGFEQDSKYQAPSPISKVQGSMRLSSYRSTLSVLQCNGEEIQVRY